MALSCPVDQTQVQTSHHPLLLSSFHMQEPPVSFLVSVVVTSRRAGGQLDYRFPMYPSWADNECACPSPFLSPVLSSHCPRLDRK